MSLRKTAVLVAVLVGTFMLVPVQSSIGASNPEAPVPAATPPINDVGPVTWEKPHQDVKAAAVVVHAPSFAHRKYPPATQAARDWAFKRLGTKQFGCLDRIWHYESGWRVKGGHPSRAYGIPQAYPGYKMASAGKDWKTNPMTQVKWGLKYIKVRYGTPCNAWAHKQVYGNY